uniref:Uncharacterized protein n=1 Tax=Nelumbo nucifera TaxID=4432 RepID=A0A822ZHY3_NELNU|nr:TPA_asm: hypothetical protein HUJ06_002717 [Nelumbo nucifera]
MIEIKQATSIGVVVKTMKDNKHEGIDILCFVVQYIKNIGKSSQ